VLITKLGEQYEANQKDLIEYQTKHNIRIKGEVCACIVCARE
jgi:effector-binding domain-containing protein